MITDQIVLDFLAVITKIWESVFLFCLVADHDDDLKEQKDWPFLAYNITVVANMNMQ